MKLSSKNENRSGQDRRSIKEHRQYDNPQYDEPERRMAKERRLVLERRAQIMSDRHFYY